MIHLEPQNLGLLYKHAINNILQIFIKIHIGGFTNRTLIVAETNLILILKILIEVLDQALKFASLFYIVKYLSIIIFQQIKNKGQNKNSNPKNEAEILVHTDLAVNSINHILKMKYN